MGSRSGGEPLKPSVAPAACLSRVEGERPVMRKITERLSKTAPNGFTFEETSYWPSARNDQHVTAKRIAKRCTLESGSFFEAVPKGGDAYIMKYIPHDWNDEECVKILANCRAAMSEKERVLVVDTVIPPGNDPGWGKLLDINMLIIGGRERTKEEFAAMFAQAGLN